VAEGAVQAESVKRRTGFLRASGAVGIEQNVGAGVDGVGERDGLLGRLIESKYRKRQIEPGGYHEDGDGDKDTGDGQSTGSNDRD
jgi:hypothetical protein